MIVFGGALIREDGFVGLFAGAIETKLVTGPDLQFPEVRTLRIDRPAQPQGFELGNGGQCADRQVRGHSKPFASQD